MIRRYRRYATYRDALERRDSLMEALELAHKEGWRRVGRRMAEYLR